MLQRAVVTVQAAVVVRQRRGRLPTIAVVAGRLPAAADEGPKGPQRLWGEATPVVFSSCKLVGREDVGSSVVDSSSGGSGSSPPSFRSSRPPPAIAASVVSGPGAKGDEGAEKMEYRHTHEAR